MIRHSALLLPCFLLASLSQTGCVMDAGMDAEADVEPGPTSFEPTQQHAVATNSLTWNSLTSNSLTSNSLVLNALNADANARSVFYYVVGCALDAGDYVDIPIGGVTQRYWGQLGIASWWGMSSMSCDEECQIAVSSCVLSRINYTGTQVQISVRGGPACVEPDNQQESTAFNKREAAYFGNIFTNPQKRYACLPAGKTSIARVCGPSLVGCVVNVIGTCDCAVDDHGYGEFDDCNFPGYPHVAPLTVFLKP